ncbi:MAG: hypothetical protein QM820_01915 [Minicystis sp.]
MNVRSSVSRSGPVSAGAVTFLALFTALPALLGGAGLSGVPLAEPAAFAQQPAPADSVTQIARQRYTEGVKAYDAGKFEDARAAFLQAYALKRHPAVLLNLGQSELRSNHPEDAGNHLQQFLREHTTATPDDRATAEKGIAEAKRRSSLVVVSVDAPGADVSIDGTTIGKSPIYDPVFIKPGKHTIFATINGKSAAVAVDAKIGVASQATLTLGAGGPAAPPAPPIPGPPLPGPSIPSGPPSAPPSAPSAGPAGPPPGMTPVMPPMGTPPMGTPPVGPPMGPGMEAPREPESFFHWYKRKPIAWVGTGLAGAGLLMGIIGGASALSASGSANDVANQNPAQARHPADADPAQRPLSPRPAQRLRHDERRRRLPRLRQGLPDAARQHQPLPHRRRRRGHGLGLLRARRRRHGALHVHRLVPEPQQGRGARRQPPAHERDPGRLADLQGLRRRRLVLITARKENRKGERDPQGTPGRRG